MIGTNQQMQSKYSCSQSQGNSKSCSLTYKINKEKLPQILINAIVEAFEFTQIQLGQHKIASLQRLNGTKSKKDPAQAHMHCSHAHRFVTCLSNGTSFLALHAPAKIKRGAHFGVLTGMSIFFLHITVQPTQESHRSK